MKAIRLLATRFLIAGMAVILAGVPEVARAGQEPAPASSQVPADGTTPSDQGKTSDTAGQEPDSPGTVKAQEEQSSPTSGAAATSQSSSQSQTTPKKPLGTAAAQPLTPSGTAASEPAGVAIAPAKQRRTRSLLIKVGAILAAGAAVGTVYALSSATGSKPPGSR